MMRVVRLVIGSMFNALPGWMVLVSGMALTAMALLMPAWREHQVLRWQHDVLSEEARQLDERVNAYQRFHDALASDDLAAVGRMAYYALHLRPEGTESAASLGRPDGGATAYVSRFRGSASSPAPDRNTTIEDALDAAVSPHDAAGRRPVPVNSRLARLTGGGSRLVMLAAGMIGVWAGLMMSGGPPRTQDDARSGA